MIKREEALKFLNEKILSRGQSASGRENKNIIKHMLATEALMGGVFDALKTKGAADLDGTKEEWMMAGLLHDGDYCEGVPMTRQGVQVTEWLRERDYEVPENVAQAMGAHNPETGIKPQNLMDWAIFCGDSLTGLIVAATLVLPSKKLADVTVENILNRFKEKSFAAGTRREDIKLCEEKLGILLREFVEISLKAMQEIAKELGL